MAKADLRFLLMLTAAAAVAAACSGGSPGPSLLPERSDASRVMPSTAHEPTTDVTRRRQRVSLDEVGRPVRLLSVAGMREQIVLPKNDAPPGASLELTVSNALPDFVSNVPGRRTRPFMSFVLKASADVEMRSLPAFMVRLPSRPSNNGAYYAWGFSEKSGWRNFGPVTVSENVIRFGGAAKRIALEADEQYAIIPFTAEPLAVCPTPTPFSGITEFSIPATDSEPSFIAAGPDGNLWFTELFGDAIGRITPGGTITQFTLPTFGFPNDITVGADGRLWFTEVFGYRKIGAITTAGVITEFPLPPEEEPNRIAAGPDGALWFTANLVVSPTPVGVIGRISTLGSLSKFTIPTGDAGPAGIARGPDDNLWFTEFKDKIGRITTGGVLTEFPIPSPIPDVFGLGANSITTGPDGNLWFTETNSRRLGKITTTGSITQRTHVGSIVDITTFQGALWYTTGFPGLGIDLIARITTGGAIGRFYIPTPYSGAGGIASGPDGNVWFTEPATNKIGRLVPP